MMALDLVCIVYAGGALIVPIDEPDYRRLIAELLECYGEVELAPGARQARVQLVSARCRRSCMQCGERLRRMMCVQQSRQLCLRCFKRVAHDDTTAPPNFGARSTGAVRAVIPVPG